MYFSFLIVLYSFSYFSPTIIRNWKFSPINTQLRTVPVWVVAWVVSMTVAYFSDRLKHRFWFVFGPTIVSIIGIIILMTVHNNIKVQYFALYLSLGGPLLAIFARVYADYLQAFSALLQFPCAGSPPICEVIPTGQSAPHSRSHSVTLAALLQPLSSLQRTLRGITLVMVFALALAFLQCCALHGIICKLTTKTRSWTEEKKFMASMVKRLLSTVSLDKGKS